MLRHKTVLGVAQAVKKTPTQACMCMLEQLLAICGLSPKSQMLLCRLRQVRLLQVLLQWSLQKGNIVIPKSSNEQRIRVVSMPVHCSRCQWRC